MEMERKRKHDFVLPEVDETETYEILYEEIDRPTEYEQGNSVHSETDQFQFVDEEEARDPQAYYELEPPIKVQKLGVSDQRDHATPSNTQQQYSIIVPQTSSDKSSSEKQVEFHNDSLICQFCDKRFDSEKELDYRSNIWMA